MGSPQGRPEAFEILRASLPDVSLLEPFFGKPRKGGQAPHDKYQLEFNDRSPIEGPWREFIEELKGPRYRRRMCHLFGVRSLSVNFHWHYAPNGCSVSPHCDSKRKLGSHVFYFNTEEDWEPAWGGQTVVLDDGGRFPTESAPRFEDFDTAIELEPWLGWAYAERGTLYLNQGRIRGMAEEVRGFRGRRLPSASRRRRAA